IRHAGAIDAKINGGNQIRVRGPAKRFTLWLRPDMGIDLVEPITIRYGNSSRKSFSFDGGLATLLEDVRQRADRKRAFWASVPIP
ncbi:MAG: alpha/beta hydrolase, partial [Planctomycetota bacterium]